MSGHITRMSRGSSVGSSCSRPTSTSRRTSTWRDGPWQACTWRLRSAGSCWRPARSVDGRRVVGAQVVLQQAEQGARLGELPGRRPPTGSPRRRATAAARGRRGRARRAAGGPPGGRTRRRRGRRHRRRPSSASHRAGDACGRYRWTSRHSPSAPSSSTSVAGRRVCPNSDSRGGRSSPAPPSRNEATTCWRGGGRAAARPPGSAVDATARAATPGRGRGSRPSPVGVAPLAPVGDERRAAGWRTTRRATPAGSPRCNGGCGAARRRGRCGRARGASPGWRTTARRGSRRWWRAGARPAVRGPTGRRPRGRSAARPATSAGGTARPRRRRRRRPRPRAGARAAASASARRHGPGRPRPPGPADRRAGAPAGLPTPPPAGRCAGPGAGGAPRGDPMRSADTTGPARSRDPRRPWSVRSGAARRLSDGSRRSGPG